MSCEVAEAVRDTLDYLVAYTVANAAVVCTDTVAGVVEESAVIFLRGDVTSSPETNNHLSTESKMNIHNLTVLGFKLEDEDHAILDDLGGYYSGDEETRNAKRDADHRNLDSYWSQFQKDLQTTTKRKSSDDSDVEDVVSAGGEYIKPFFLICLVS